MLTEYDRRRLDEWTAEAIEGDDSPVMMSLPLKVVERLMADRLQSARLVCKLMDAKDNLETDLATYREVIRQRPPTDAR